MSLKFQYNGWQQIHDNVFSCFIAEWNTLTRKFTPTIQQQHTSCSLTQQADEDLCFLLNFCNKEVFYQWTCTYWCYYKFENDLKAFANRIQPRRWLENNFTLALRRNFISLQIFDECTVQWCWCMVFIFCLIKRVLYLLYFVILVIIIIVKISLISWLKYI